MFGWIRAGEDWRGWGDCLKYLKRGWNRKEGRGSKDFKKGGGGKLGQGVGALKRRGWNPPTNYELFIEKCPSGTQHFTAFLQDCYNI